MMTEVASGLKAPSAQISASTHVYAKQLFKLAIAFQGYSTLALQRGCQWSEARGELSRAMNGL